MNSVTSLSGKDEIPVINEKNFKNSTEWLWVTSNNAGKKNDKCSPKKQKLYCQLKVIQNKSKQTETKAKSRGQNDRITLAKEKESKVHFFQPPYNLLSLLFSYE